MSQAGKSNIQGNGRKQSKKPLKKRDSLRFRGMEDYHLYPGTDPLSFKPAGMNKEK